MLIRPFDNSDIPRASELAKLTWGDFYTGQSSELQALIYGFTVEYYDLNRKYSFSIMDDELKGFLLAFKKSDSLVGSDFKDKVKALNDPDEKKTALGLFDYLEHCGREVKNIMDANDIMLGLFVSIQKGCGRMLLSRLNDVCRENRVNNIYLWTDTTCDYGYYRRNNFELCKETETFLNGQTIKTFIHQRKVI